MRRNISGLLKSLLLSFLQNINLLRKPGPEWLRMKCPIRRKPCREGGLNLLALIDLAGGRCVLNLDLIDRTMLLCEGLDGYLRPPKPTWSVYTFSSREGGGGDRGNTHSVTIFPNPSKHLPSFHSPNPVLQQRIQQEIGSNSPSHPCRFRGFPAQLAVEIERDTSDCDSSIT